MRRASASSSPGTAASTRSTAHAKFTAVGRAARICAAACSYAARSPACRRAASATPYAPKIPIAGAPRTASVRIASTIPVTLVAPLAHYGAWQRPLIEKSDGVAVVPDRIHGNADSAGVSELLCFGYTRTALVANNRSAVDGPVAARAERHRGGRAALRADGVVHLAQPGCGAGHLAQAVARWALRALRQSRQRCGSFSKPFSA